MGSIRWAYVVFLLVFILSSWSLRMLLSQRVSHKVQGGEKAEDE
jgi:hypothetical protein